MIQRLAVIGVLVCLSSPAAAEEWHPKLLQGALLAAVGAHGADLAVSEHCLNNGVCGEGNPMLRPFVGRPVVFGAVKGGTALSLFLVKQHYREKYPRSIFWFSVAETVIISAVAIHNSRVQLPVR